MEDIIEAVENTAERTLHPECEKQKTCARKRQPFTRITESISARAVISCDYICGACFFYDCLTTKVGACVAQI